MPHEDPLQSLISASSQQKKVCLLDAHATETSLYVHTNDIDIEIEIDIDIDIEIDIEIDIKIDIEIEIGIGGFNTFKHSNQRDEVTVQGHYV